MNAAVHEHEFEAAHGLPEALPAGERVLWQGAPDFRDLAVRCFHLRTVALYFAAILLVRGLYAGTQTGSFADGAVAAVWLLPPVLIALGMLALMAYLSSRTTAYTITDRRIVMRVGIVLSLTFNLPFSRIESAAARLKAGSTGDIALTLAPGEQIAYVHLWPHARPWKIARTQPMLRSVAEAQAAARVLTEAWSAARSAATSAAGAAPQAAAAANVMPFPARRPAATMAAAGAAARRVAS